MANFPKVSLFVVAFVSVCASALVAHARENDAMLVLQSKTPLSEAVAVAEQHVSGKASRAEFEHTKAGWAYDVEVVSGTDVYDVRVAADTGAVLSSVKDKKDRDRDSGHDD